MYAIAAFAFVMVAICLVMVVKPEAWKAGCAEIEFRA